MDTPQTKINVRQEFCRLYRKFCNYIIETRPNYVDQDFSFDNFMEYLDYKEDDRLM